MIKKIFLFLLISNSAFGGATIPEIPDEKYINYAEKIDCVVRLNGDYGEKIKTSACGVIISENWILTAAHVLYMMKNPHFYLKEKKFTISKIIINKEFDIKKNISNGDIALCYVEQKINLKLYPKLYEKKDEYNKKCIISGFGSYGSALTGAIFKDSNKRAGSNEISCVTDCLLFCDMSKQNPTFLEFLPSSGDSGGGLFIDGKLAGINSFVSATDGIADSSYEDKSGHTRISKYKSWIELIIGK